jgi:tetratricopeptide (TPR) repeat protein
MYGNLFREEPMKKRRRDSYLVLSLVLIFFVLPMSGSCKTAEFGFRVTDVHGMIYDFSNRPVGYCEITLGKKLKSTSDINGRFSLPKVALGNYALEINKTGFESYSEEVTIRERGQVIYIRLPSQNQLLDLVDEALVSNNIPAASELAERAYRIDPNSVETLFYLASIKFRQHDYDAAIAFLENAKSLGSKDQYIEKFILQLKELQDEKNQKEFQDENN